MARTSAALARAFTTWLALREARMVMTGKIQKHGTKQQCLVLQRLFGAWGDVTSLRAHRARRVRGAVARWRRAVP